MIIGEIESFPWKVSRYVTTIDLAGVNTLLVYSGLGGRLIEVPGPYRKEAYSLLEDPDSSRNSTNFPLTTLFQEQGVLIPENCDEAELLKQRYEDSRRHKSNSPGLTLCPTLSCNFRCVYCYQTHPKVTMSEKVQDNVIGFLEQNYPSLTSLAITWFGGESLLALRVIERLSRRFIDFAGEHFKYRASIITNGYLLTPNISKLLLELQIKEAQITLDGPRDIHDSRRPHMGGYPTFDKIIENIALADRRLQIVVRINIDQENVEKSSELFAQLDSAGLRGRISVYFAPVIPYTEICNNVSGSCIIGRPWSKTHARLQLIALNRGYASPALPGSRANFCLADSNHGWVVRPDGLVCKCWNDVTQTAKSVFNLSTRKQNRRMKNVADQWLSWSPFNFPKCRECKFLPQCMGGCPYLGLRANIRQHGYCSELRHNLPEIVALYYLSFKKKETSDQLLRIMNQCLPEIVPNPG